MVDVQPTFFFGVPRVWEKIEVMKQILDADSLNIRC